MLTLRALLAKVALALLSTISCRLFFFQTHEPKTLLKRAIGAWPNDGVRSAMGPGVRNSAEHSHKARVSEAPSILHASPSPCVLFPGASLLMERKRWDREKESQRNGMSDYNSEERELPCSCGIIVVQKCAFPMAGFSCCARFFTSKVHISTHLKKNVMSAVFTRA